MGCQPKWPPPLQMERKCRWKILLPLGITLARAGVRYLGPLVPEDLFRIGEFTLDRTVLLTTPESDYPTPADAQNFFDRATAELRGLPGIEQVGLVQPLPMNHAIWSLQFSRPDRPPAAAEDWPWRIGSMPRPTISKRRVSPCSQAGPLPTATERMRFAWPS